MYLTLSYLLLCQQTALFIVSGFYKLSTVNKIILKMQLKRLHSAQDRLNAMWQCTFLYIDKANSTTDRRYENIHSIFAYHLSKGNMQRPYGWWVVLLFLQESRSDSRVCWKNCTGIKQAAFSDPDQQSHSGMSPSHFNHE